MLTVQDPGGLLNAGVIESAPCSRRPEMTIKKLEGRLGRTRKELAKARHIILLLGRENVRLRGVTSLLWEQCKALNVMAGYDLERQVRAALARSTDST